MLTHEILRQLIQFNTVSSNSNKELMQFVIELLKQHGIEATVIPNQEGNKCNLYATVGPSDKRGVMLSGHTDVVPTDGQNWTQPAFSLTEVNERYYGRGTADMKGFIACALQCMLNAADIHKQTPLNTPLHLALSYDEEVGCVGVASLIDMLRHAPVMPAMCIVGEPTEMRIAVGHKGKAALSACCTGVEAHSALAPQALNAIHLGCDFMSVLRGLQNRYAMQGIQDTAYDIPYTTLHAGIMHAGTALNIVPNQCTIDFEIRHLANDDVTQIIDELAVAAANIVAPHRQQHPTAAIDIALKTAYPGLITDVNANVVSLVSKLTDSQDSYKVAYGTEGGLFSTVLGIPTVVCGPGSMQQGHKPDEYIEKSQLERCNQVLAKLIDELRSESFRAG